MDGVRFVDEHVRDQMNSSFAGARFPIHFSAPVPPNLHQGFPNRLIKTGT